MSIISIKPFNSAPTNAKAWLVLQDDTILEGHALGAWGIHIGELCFNTAMSGYQEIMSDPSYDGQIITFTTPHIGNVGCNDNDYEALAPAFKGCVLRNAPTVPSNFRSQKPLHEWLHDHGIGGIYGVDTRALTHVIREKGVQNCAVVVGAPDDADFDRKSVLQQIRDWQGLEDCDLAIKVTTKTPYQWTGRGNGEAGRWLAHSGYAPQDNSNALHIVCIDYGVKHNILRNFVSLGCRVSVVPADTSCADIMAYKPDGVFLSNGPGDPAATGIYAIAIIKDLLNKNIPMFGICLGHQILALALGAKTIKMHNGHHGANHPIKDLTTGKMEITSQNHGFVVDGDTLPSTVEATHFSLFDGTLAGIAMKDAPVFSVQYHPEASPGPMDSHYLFERFVKLIKHNNHS